MCVYDGRDVVRQECLATPYNDRTISQQRNELGTLRKFKEDVSLEYHI